MFTVILTIFALTVERFKAIRDPFFALQGSTKCKSVRIVTSLWVALTIYSVAAMFFVLDPDSQGMDEFIFGQHCMLISSKDQWTMKMKEPNPPSCRRIDKNRLLSCHQKSALSC